MRKIMSVLSALFGIITFAAIGYASREGSNFNVAYACIPALICIMTAIAGDKSDEQHLDLDEAETDPSGY